MPFTMHVTLSPCSRERRQEFISPEMWPSKFARFESGGLQHLRILQERVYRSQIHDMKELKERLLSRWRLLNYTIAAAAIAQWHSCLNACFRMNGGHFEHKFWASDFLLCYVSCIDTCGWKFLQSCARKIMKICQYL